MAASEGKAWERRAERFLNRQGLRTVDRNFHCRHGEIDLVMLHDESLVFVEVRYRKSSQAYGGSTASVSMAKQQRICRAAAAYLGRRKGASERNCRFDVVSMGGPATNPGIEWLRNAFDTNGVYSL